MLSRLFGRRKKSSTASIAKERLQIIVAHERVKNSRNNPDFLTDLQRDILAVVRKYIPVDSEQIKVAMDQEDGCDVLELNIVLSDISEPTDEALTDVLTVNEAAIEHNAQPFEQTDSSANDDLDSDNQHQGSKPYNSQRKNRKKR